MRFGSIDISVTKITETFLKGEALIYVEYTNAMSDQLDR